MTNQPTESPEAMAERLLPCVDAGNCGEWGHYDDCPVNLRPAVATALQAERERQDTVPRSRYDACNQGWLNEKAAREKDRAAAMKYIAELETEIAKQHDEIEAERERALEEVLRIIDKIGHEYAGGFISDCLNDLEDRVCRALAQKGGGE